MSSPTYNPPFIIKLLKSEKYHLVSGHARGYYWTTCGLRLNYSSLDTDRGRVARITRLTPREVQHSWRDQCHLCARTGAWKSHCGVAHWHFRTPRTEPVNYPEENKATLTR